VKYQQTFTFLILFHMAFSTGSTHRFLSSFMQVISIFFSFFLYSIINIFSYGAMESSGSSNKKILVLALSLYIIMIVTISDLSQQRIWFFTPLSWGLYGGLQSNRSHLPGMFHWQLHYTRDQVFKTFVLSKKSWNHNERLV
jgi:hypothetical protein